MSVKPLLDVRDLSVSFTANGSTTPVVNNVSFVLNESETVAIVGESGSGKTVSALTILRLIPDPPGKITGGEIRYHDEAEPVRNLLALGEQELQKIRGRRISMVFQEPMTSLNPVFTCGDQVAESLVIHMGMTKKEARLHVTGLFQEVKLPDPAAAFRAYPHQLSGGQKQRVMIAMAIACNPAILIADEPTTALDVTVQKTILELLKRLQESRKMSILFITHDLGLVAGFADRVLVMNRGSIVEEGTVSAIFSDPQHPYTRGLLACRPTLGERPERLPTIDAFIARGEAPAVRLISRAERLENHALIYSQEPVLKVEGVSKYFESFEALKKTDFQVFPGETLGIVGESGSGKTTLARVVLELIPASQGRVLYRDKDITWLTGQKMKELRKDLQIIFQDPYSSLNPRKAIGPAILEPMKVHGLFRSEKERKERVFELLRKVGLHEDHYFRFPHEFSGGQRQRICIARALAVEPRLIICDESVSALDVSIQAQVLNLLNDLKREMGLTYIFISHDLSVVKFMSDRLIVMKNGRIEEMGDADEIYQDPKSEYTRILLAAMPEAHKI